MRNTHCMKKIILSSIFIIAVAGYVIYQNMTGQANITVAVSNNKNEAAVQAATSSSNTAANAGAYKNGVYTGSVENAYYGNVQAEAIIKNGALADVAFLQYPNHGHSLQVSQESMPILKSEAIQSQSAQVDAVSGATQTSDAFQQSLSSALALAKD
jgi:uncharacterized protein with FMN-binding domain